MAASFAAAGTGIGLLSLRSDPAHAGQRCDWGASSIQYVNDRVVGPITTGCVSRMQTTP